MRFEVCKTLALSFLIVVIQPVTASFKWTNAQTSRTSRDQLDLWTEKPFGCSCPYNVLDSSCACCVHPSGCHCGHGNPQRCAQCGTEAFCDNMCNLTLSSRELESRSGQTYGELKSPSHLSGPTLCWYRFQARPGERVELQLYRLKRVGTLDKTNNRCFGGFLQLQHGESSLTLNPLEVAFCGQNERYFPPIVLFQDFDPNDKDAPRIATMVFKVDETTPRSQFLAHFSFTPIGSEKTGIQIQGGTRLDNNHSKLEQGCDWVFKQVDCSRDNGCQIASPGYPGVYPPNRRCRYLLTTDQTQTGDIRIQFKDFSMPEDECDSHHVTIYRGTSSLDPVAKMLCGFQHPQTFNFKGEKSILVEFSSGAIVSPINYNGFMAKVEFLSRKEGDSDQDEAQQRQDHLEHNHYIEDWYEDPDEYEDYYDEYEEDRDEYESGYEEKNEEDEHSSEYSSTSSCLLQFHGNETRSGRFSSGALALDSDGSCTIAFRGNPGDVVIIDLTAYKLKGSTCDSSIMVSVPEEVSRVGDNPVKMKICSPAHESKKKQKSLTSESRKNGGPLLVNYSTVNLEFKAGSNYASKFKGVFKFHQVLTEGYPVPNSTCDRIFSGRTGPQSGIVEGPAGDFMNGLTPLLRHNKANVRCLTNLMPTEAQSVTIMVKSNPSYPIDRADGKFMFACETQCDNSGCVCSRKTSPTSPYLHNQHGIEDFDSLKIRAVKPDGTPGGELGCFCGDFSHLLPVTLISASSVTFELNLVSGPSDWHNGITSQGFAFSAQYGFHNEETCGPRRIPQPLGSLEAPLSLSPPQSFYSASTYFHLNCQWFFDPPPSRQIVLDISTAQKGVRCSTWNATISEWDSSRPGQIGMTIDKFCPETISKEYVLDTINRKIVISLQSLSSVPIHYRITWATRGLLSRTGVMSAGSTVNLSGASIHQVHFHDWILILTLTHLVIKSPSIYVIVTSFFSM